MRQEPLSNALGARSETLLASSARQVKTQSGSRARKRACCSWPDWNAGGPVERGGPRIVVPRESVAATNRTPAVAQKDTGGGGAQPQRRRELLRERAMT